jgi:hypothetical protein
MRHFMLSVIYTHKTAIYRQFHLAVSASKSDAVIPSLKPKCLNHTQPAQKLPAPVSGPETRKNETETRPISCTDMSTMIRKHPQGWAAGVAEAGIG